MSFARLGHENFEPALKIKEEIKSALKGDIQMLYKWLPDRFLLFWCFFVCFVCFFTRAPQIFCLMTAAESLRAEAWEEKRLRSEFRSCTVRQLLGPFNLARPQSSCL